MLKLISWNVNGIRAAVRKKGFSFLDEEKPDILCLQETRALPEEAGDPFPKLAHSAWNPAEKPGYAGTAVFSRHPPLSVRAGMGVKEHDREGRVLVFELDPLFIVSVYTPNSRRDLTRLPYRRLWDRAFLRFLEGLQAEKPVVFCGDLNVAHEEIDLARPRENRGTHGFTDEERVRVRGGPGRGVRRQFSRAAPRGRALHVVEPGHALAGAKCRVADRLCHDLRGPAPGSEEGVHPSPGDRLRPLPGRDRAGPQQF